MEVQPSPNFATCVSFRPFVVTSWKQRKEDEFELDPALFGDAAENDLIEPITEVATSSTTVVTAQHYGKPSAELSSLGFETMFAVKCLAKKLDIPRLEEPTEVYVATVWCLLSETPYTLTYRFTDDADGDAAPLAVNFTTTQLLNIFVNKKLDAQFVPAVEVLQRCDVVDMLNAQGEEEMLSMWPPDPASLASMGDGVRFVLYDALFLLPAPLFVGGHVMWLLRLPNGPKRYVLDFTRGRDATTTPDSANAAPAFPWRRHARVRKLIRGGADGKYAVVVHDGKDGILQALKRAETYHRQHDHSTWLSDQLNLLLATTADQCRYEDLTHVVYGTPGLRLLCVDLVEASSGKVLAGCCGFACGAVYHDYTMYTLERSTEGFGTCLTKLIGEALQQCGYDLWYWGFRLGYMADYDAHYGGTDMDRSAFYDRWCAARDRQPTTQFLWEFLRAGRGMLPHYHGAAAA